MNTTALGDKETPVLGTVAVAIGAAWIGSVWIVLAVVVGLITVGASLRAWTPVREAARRHRLRRGRDLKMQGCVARLEAAGVAEERVRALQALGVPVGHTNDELIDRFPVDELLDGYADLEIERQQGVRVLTNVSRDGLLTELGQLTPGDAIDQQRSATLELRLRTWDECHDRVRYCERQIALLAGIVQTIQLRAAVPAHSVERESAQRALDDLEHHHAVLAEVSALTP